MFTEPDNGVLALVRGEEVAAGNMSLPNPQIATAPVMFAEVASQRFGKVRIEYHLKINKQRKARYRYWVAVRADRMDAPKRP